MFRPFDEILTSWILQRLTVPVVDNFIADLKDAVRDAKLAPSGKGTMTMLYGKLINCVHRRPPSLMCFGCRPRVIQRSRVNVYGHPCRGFPGYSLQGVIAYCTDWLVVLRHPRALRFGIPYLDAVSPVAPSHTAACMR